MPRMTVELPIDTLAQTISLLTEEERESLALLLSEHGGELKQRRDNIQQGTVTTLSEAEVFAD
jgi:hypothetical protein